MSEELIELARKSSIMSSATSREKTSAVRWEALGHWVLVESKANSLPLNLSAVPEREKVSWLETAALRVITPLPSPSTQTWIEGEK